MGRNGKWLALAVAATMAAACEQSPTAVPADGDFEMAAALAGGLPDGAGFQVIACKDGPAGVYNFEASTTTGPGNGGTTVVQPTFTLTAGDANLECAVVATASTSFQEATVGEVAPFPANTTLADITVYRWFTGANSGAGGFTGSQTFVDTEVTVQFGNDVGRVIVFRNVPVPSTGCTLTQGYWKTHSEYGPAPYNNTWALLSSGADTPFYFSGQSWIQVFTTPPSGGNAYYNLAHQYMAAKLNLLAGASAPQNVLDAIDDAEALFDNAANTPSSIGALKGNDALRQEFLALAGILGSYNEGTIGPGHCGD